MGTTHRSIAHRMMTSLQMLFMLTLPLLALAQQQGPNGSGGQSIELTWERIVAGFVMILVGIILTFRGYRHYHFTMFLAGFITGAAIVYSIFTNVEPDSGWNHQQIIYVFGCIGGGIVLGTICWLFRRFLVWILSGLAGLIIALYVLAWRSEGLIRSKGGRIGLLVGAPALGILIGLFIGRRVVILASAIIGAYITVIGIDLFARTGFAESIKRFFTTNPKVDYSLTTNIYIMLGVVGGLIILGLLFQTLSWKHRQRALMAQGRSVHNFNDDWTLFGHKDHAVRPDPTYPDGNYANNYNTGTGYGNTSNARGVDDHTAYNEKSTWNPFKKNKKGDATPATPATPATTTTAAPNDFHDNRVSYSSNAALTQNH